MDQALTAFADRKTEILSYLDFVEAIERAVQLGVPIIKFENEEYKVSPLQQRILYAGIYLHLYNLVESTVTLLIQAVEKVAKDGGKRQVADLSAQMRRQWVRSVACTHQESLHPEKRLEHVLVLCDQFMGLIPLDFEIPKGIGGNWDDDAIEKLAEKLGLPLTVSQDMFSAIKRPTRDNKGPLKLIKDLRNKLAHGAISFAECGNDHVASDLRQIAQITLEYMEQVSSAFKRYVATYEYLDVARRPRANAAESNAQ